MNEPDAPSQTPPQADSGVAARSADPPADAPSEQPPPQHDAPPVSGRLHAVLWLAIGCAVVGVIQVPMAILARRGAPAKEVAVASATPSVSATSSTPAPALAAPPASASASAEPEPGPPPFRIAQLAATDPDLDVVQAKVGKRSCVQALGALGVTQADATRLSLAAAKVRKLEGCTPTDRLFVATSKSTKVTRAIELETAPGEMLRVIERALLPANSGANANVGAPADLVAEHVTLPVTHKRQATAFVVGPDLAASITAAGLDASLVDVLDEALSTRTDMPAPHAGSVFRVVADATFVAGHFDRYDEVIAFEYRPRPEATPLRLYHLRDAKTAKTHGWYDGKGHAPAKTHWRMPLAFPRITSRFNPHRLHPVLHVVMPHNGCDFAASPGTPVYAIGAGVVTFRGEAGPSGNLVMIEHEGGISSGYAHLSRFAPGVVPGTHVEPRTLVGYSGTTGRSTGPHLHLSVKKHGVFIDPLSLKMDGFRVVPASERNAFTARKQQADFALDAIALPKVDSPPAPAPSASAETAGDDTPADELPK